MSRTIYAADLFCGAGGTSTGLLQAAQRLGKNVRLVAINHWQVAIDTHQANHPGARHLTTGLEAVTPADVVPSGRLDLLWASPSCTHHSVARGGRPRCNQSRAQPHLILDWLDQLYVKRLMIENVPAFTSWGPLNARGQPIKAKAGVLFDDYIRSLEVRGYRCEWRILCCADYGDATTRERFFLQAVRGRGKIRWPEPTHFKQPDSSQEYKPWVPARDVIDWSIHGTSIFRRKKPLAENTLRRIEAGIRKYWGAWAEPFLIVLRGTKAPERTTLRLDAPLPTLTAGGGHVALVEPFLSTVAHGTPDGNFDRRVYGLDEPFRTLTATGEQALIEPFIVPQHSCGANRGMNQPIPTITSGGAHALVEPFITTAGGAEGQGRTPLSVNDTLGTILPNDRRALVEPFMTVMNNWPSQQAGYSIERPLPSQTTSNHVGLVEPFFVSFYGNGEALPIDQPFATITTKDRFGIVQQYGLDILFRMLQPHELARAHSFPDNYIFDGTKSDVAKQIGNSVPCKTSEALCFAALGDAG